jgi:hypothetical protein
MLIMCSIITKMQDCFLSADDGCVSGTQADVQENQVIAVFNENSVSFTLHHKQCCSSANVLLSNLLQVHLKDLSKTCFDQIL